MDDHIDVPLISGVIPSYAAGSISNVLATPGAMGEEIRVDCCLMTNDGRSVVTGSSLGPPQVWNMSVSHLSSSSLQSSSIC